MIQIGGVYTTFCQEEAYFCKSIAIEMGGVSRYFSKVSGSGVDFALLIQPFLYRAGAESPLNFRENFRVSPRTILKIFSAVDTQTAVLVSTAEVWISAPDTQTPTFLGFLGIHS